MSWKRVYFDHDDLMIFEKGLAGCGHGFPKAVTISGSRREFALQGGVRLLVSKWWQHISPDPTPPSNPAPGPLGARK